MHIIGKSGSLGACSRCWRRCVPARCNRSLTCGAWRAMWRRGWRTVTRTACCTWHQPLHVSNLAIRRIMAIARERCVLPPLRRLLRSRRGVPAVFRPRLRLPQAQAAPQGAWRWQRLGGGGVDGASLAALGCGYDARRPSPVRFGVRSQHQPPHTSNLAIRRIMAIARERRVLPPLRCMLRGWCGAPAVLGLRLRLPQAQAAPQGARRWRRCGGGGIAGIQALAAMDA